MKKNNYSEFRYYVATAGAILGGLTTFFLTKSPWLALGAEKASLSVFLGISTGFCCGDGVA